MFDKESGETIYRTILLLIDSAWFQYRNADINSIFEDAQPVPEAAKLEKHDSY